MPPRKRKATEEAPAPVVVTELYDVALSGDGWNQPPLLGMPELSVRKARKGAPRTKKGVSWARYKVLKPVHCDTCVRLVHEAWRDGGTRAPNPACYRRRDAEGDTYWCWTHMEEKRSAEGLSPLKTQGK